MATVLARKGRAFRMSAANRASQVRVTIAGAVFLGLAATACSDNVVSPEARPDGKGKGPTKDTTTTSTTTTTDTVTIAPTTDTTSSTTTTTTTTTTTSTSNPILGASFYVNPNSNAQKTADSWRITRPADATQMDKIASQSFAVWFGNWNTNILNDVNNATTTITNAGRMPVFVAYNIPQRDCGGLSGGTTTTDAYKTWIANMANGIGSRKAVVILEPDALAAMSCLSSTDQQTRVDLLKYAVTTFKAKGQIYVYLDGGHPKWQSASTMADRLKRAGIDLANGFSLNVSNFIYTTDNITYGNSISSLVAGKHFIIDTGRNGLGPTADYQWCNPDGRAIGLRPTTVTNSALVDAYLWIKVPGESDGACNGYTSAGSWLAEYALGLAQRG